MGVFDRIFRRSGPDRFAADVLGRLRAAGIRDARYHADLFAIEYRPRSDREPAWMYLANLYAECQRDPQGRLVRIDRFVATFASLPGMPETWEEARPLLRPVLRGASFGRATRTRRRVVLRRPALPYLDELVVVDQPTSMGYVTEGLWGVPAEQVFAAARENLAADRVLSEPDSETGPAVLRFFDAGDSYFVSRILVDGWLASLSERVGGRPVAFVPDPNSLVVVADDPHTLAVLFESVAQEYAEAPRALSPMGYTLDEYGQLTPYEPVGGGDGGPLPRLVGRAERTLAVVEYEAQRAILRQDETVDDWYVAACLLANREDGSAFTASSWAKDLSTLLPKVDFVALSPADDATTFVPWQALADEDLLDEAVEYRPARYRVGAYPRPDVLARLVARAVTP